MQTYIQNKLSFIDKKKTYTKKNNTKFNMTVRINAI